MRPTRRSSTRKTSLPSINPVVIVRSAVSESGIVVLEEGFRSYEAVIKSFYDQHYRITYVNTIGDIMITHLEKKVMYISSSLPPQERHQSV